MFFPEFTNRITVPCEQRGDDFGMQVFSIYVRSFCRNRGTFRKFEENKPERRYLLNSPDLGEYRVQAQVLSSRSSLEGEEKHAKVHRPKNKWKKIVDIWCFIATYRQLQNCQ
jgi:predicted DNA-binding transcriptional regulator YafY